MVPNATSALFYNWSPWFLPIRRSFNSTPICLTCCYFVKRKTSRGSLRKTRLSQICTRNNKKTFRTIYTGDFHFCTNTYFKAFSFQPLEIHETVAECMIFANHWVAKKIAESFPSTALVRISCNGCYCSCACKQSFFCFQLHTDEAKWVNTMETDPLASFKTSDNWNNSNCVSLCTCFQCQLPYTEPNCLSF